ncbi:MAG: hypothetical protein JKY71_02670 [Alphaproteobacteria bacterium]|nr:hypothetical protein [Alphaproteobacteria bacterium]
MTETVLYRVFADKGVQGFAADSGRGRQVFTKPQGTFAEDSEFAQTINMDGTNVIGLLDSDPEREIAHHELAKRCASISRQLAFSIHRYDNAGELIRSVDDDVLKALLRLNTDLSDVPEEQRLSASITDTLQRIEGTIDPNQPVDFLFMFMKAGANPLPFIHEWHNEDRYPKKTGQRQVQRSLTDQGMQFAFQYGTQRNEDGTYEVSAGVAMPTGIAMFDFLSKNVHRAPPPSETQDRMTYSLTCTPMGQG